MRLVAIAEAISEVEDEETQTTLSDLLSAYQEALDAEKEALDKNIFEGIEVETTNLRKACSIFEEDIRNNKIRGNIEEDQELYGENEEEYEQEEDGEPNEIPEQDPEMEETQSRVKQVELLDEEDGEENRDERLNEIENENEEENNGINKNIG